jgi:hypothetical protein
MVGWHGCATALSERRARASCAENLARFQIFEAMELKLGGSIAVDLADLADFWAQNGKNFEDDFEHLIVWRETPRGGTGARGCSRCPSMWRT